MNDNNHGKKAVEALAKDVAALASGLTGRNPEDIEFAAVIEYLELLKSEATKVQNGVYAKDNSILYACPEGITFEKRGKTK